MIYTDELFEAAFRFRATKLWKRVSSDGLIALRHADGQISYCCVMGRANPDVMGVAVYMGEQGLRSYLQVMAESHPRNRFEMLERHLQMDCVTCFFENKDDVGDENRMEIQQYCRRHDRKLRGRKAYPDFERYRRLQVPGMVTDAEDQQRLLDALTACARLSDALDAGETLPPQRPETAILLEEADGALRLSPLPLPELAEEPYPSPELRDELQLRRMQKQARGSADWAVDLLLFPEPVQGGKNSSGLPVYCYLLVIMDVSQQIILAGEMMRAWDYAADEAVRRLAKAIEANGKPARLLVRNDRARALVGGLARQLSIPVRQESEIFPLRDMLDEMMEHVGAHDEENAEEEAAMREEVLRLLDNEEVLRKLPYEMLLQLSQVVAIEEVPQSLVRKLMAELKRRRRG